MLFLCGRSASTAAARRQSSSPAASGGCRCRARTLLIRWSPDRRRTGLIAPGEVTVDFIRNAGAAPGDTARWHGDADARRPITRFEASRWSRRSRRRQPSNAAPVTSYPRYAETSPISGALHRRQARRSAHLAARVLEAARSRPAPLLVAPASRRDQEAAARGRTLGILQDAGAKTPPNACRVLCRLRRQARRERHLHLLDRAQLQRAAWGRRARRSISGSPATVAASAVMGRIAGPRAVTAEQAAHDGGRLSSATTSIPTRWRRACTWKPDRGDRRPLPQKRSTSYAAHIKPGDVVAGEDFGAQLLARAGARRSSISAPAWWQIVQRHLLSQRPQSRTAGHRLR